MALISFTLELPVLKEVIDGNTQLGNGPDSAEAFIHFASAFI